MFPVTFHFQIASLGQVRNSFCSAFCFSSVFSSEKFGKYVKRPYFCDTDQLDHKTESEVKTDAIIHGCLSINHNVQCSLLLPSIHDKAVNDQNIPGFRVQL